jgi:hypothetical protein
VKSVIDAIEQRCSEQIVRADNLLEALEEFGWKDTRPARTEAKRETRCDIPDFTVTVEVPALVRIPSHFIHAYHEWYAASLALVEGNMPVRRSEMVALHEGLKGVKEAPVPMMQLLQQQRMSFDEQIIMATRITHMKSVVGSIPAYMNARLYDIELAVAHEFARDELSEAEILLKSGFVRAAGGMAGVVLERHLKLLCGRQHPPLKYVKNAGISKLNDILREAGVYEVAQWRKVQWMGDIRNGCDHVRSSEPPKQDIQDLIKEVSKFVSLFVV